MGQVNEASSEPQEVIGGERVGKGMEGEESEFFFGG